MCVHILVPQNVYDEDDEEDYQESGQDGEGSEDAEYSHEETGAADPAPGDYYETADVDAPGEEEYPSYAPAVEDTAMGEEHVAVEDEEEEEVSRPQRGKSRRVIQSDNDEDVPEVKPAARVATVTTRGRTTMRPAYYDEISDEEDVKLKSRTLVRGRQEDEFVDDDDEDYLRGQNEDTGYGKRKKSSKSKSSRGAPRATTASKARKQARKDSLAADESYASSQTADTSSDDDLDLNDDDEESLDGEGKGKKYTFRERADKVNYFLPAANAFDAPFDAGSKGKGKARTNKSFALPGGLSGAQLAALYPEKRVAAGDDSVSQPSLGPSAATLTL